jgi:aminoglycoside phosphotransferase (APT) family kinase protein
MITALPQLLQTEARFYRELAHSVPVIRPTVLATQRRWGQGTTVVLADVTEDGFTPGSPGDALTAAQATSVIEQLAHLHARFWHKAGLDSADDWLAGSMRRWEDRLGSALAVPLMGRGLSRAGDIVPATLHAPALRYASQRRRAMQFLAAGPHTLVHHDLHPGNFFWQESQSGFLDWQLVRIGEGIGDIAYFLATALAPETRRMHELDLLTRYQQILAEQGIEQDSATLLQRYRVHLAYPFEAMVVTLAVGGMMELAANLELIRRTAAAIMDHDTYTGFHWS